MIESTDDNLKGSFNNLKGFHDYNFFFQIANRYNRWGSFNLFHFSKLEVQARPKSENYPRCR